LKVKDVMVTDLVVVDADVSVKEAVERMNDFEIGCLLVISGEKVVGILTERDILRRVVAEGRKPEETLVKDIMSKPLVVVDPETSLEEAVELMFKHKIKKLPVVKDDKLVGLVTFTDIARFQPVIAKYAERLAAGQALPRRMEKVIRYYIA
jgi:CBS domain-containing protein